MIDKERGRGKQRHTKALTEKKSMKQRVKVMAGVRVKLCTSRAACSGN